MESPASPTVDTPAAAPAEAPSVVDVVRGALERLRHARLSAARAAHDIATLREEFEAEHAYELQVAKNTAELVEQLDREVRSLTLAAHDLTHETKPCPGVEVVFTEEITWDAEQALEWARRSQTALLPESVDAKALKKIAKATPLPFVTITKVPAVRIASDLDKALGSDA